MLGGWWWRWNGGVPQRPHVLRVCCAPPQNHAPQEFPDVERLHKAKQLDKMCSKGLWGVSGKAGSPAALA